MSPAMRRALSVRGALGVLLVAALAAGTLSACSSGGTDDRLTIYSGRTQELIEPLLEQFSDDTGIGIDVRYGDSSDLALLIDEEGDQSPADVFLSQSPGSTGYLDSKDRLQPVKQSVLDLVPERFRADDGNWVGVSGRVRVLVADPEIPEGELPAVGVRRDGREVPRPGRRRAAERVVPGLRHRDA